MRALQGKGIRVLAVAHSLIRAWAEKFLEVLDGRDPHAIAKLFALNATLEDPVGTSLCHGRDAIRQTFLKAAAEQFGTEIRRMTPISVAANYAACGVLVAIDTGGTRHEIDSIVIFHFSDDGLVTSMRSFWNMDETRSVTAVHRETSA
jgi:steroid delta-isomerase